VPRDTKKEMNTFLVNSARAGCLNFSDVSTQIVKIPKLLARLLEYLFGDVLLHENWSKNFSMRMINSLHLSAPLTHLSF
jgi:hypothetical protein